MTEFLNDLTKYLSTNTAPNKVLCSFKIREVLDFLHIIDTTARELLVNHGNTSS